MRLQTAVAAVIGVAMVTTLVLDGRATPRAIDAVFSLITNPLKTIMGR